MGANLSVQDPGVDKDVPVLQVVDHRHGYDVGLEVHKVKTLNTVKQMMSCESNGVRNNKVN